ncbi:MAG TPA: DUF3667 domain-containing protein [Steroidobacteraceae bacterium]|jgi:hypothetical protein|nr:DUF3667 domain-containing protein [Steroidobacteraceae bacterium]
MNPDFPEVGALVSAGLAAKEIDAVSVPDRHGAETGTQHKCLNCGAALSARYCGSCGQPAHLHRSLWHLSEEFLHGVLHFDAKGIRTAPLLAFRPGLLTRRYIDGQRTRYVSPMALFLFCIFLMYFVFSLAAGGDSHNVVVKTEDARSAKADLAKAQQEADEDVAKATAKLEQLKKAGADLTEAQQELAEAQFAKKMSFASGAIASAAIDLSSRSAAQAGTPKSGDSTGSTDAEVGGGTWQERLAAKAKQRVGEPGIKGKIYRSLVNPDLALYKLKSTAYKFSFMLIPISLPFLWLMFFWKRDVAMYDHGVFALYSLSFMALLFTLAALMAMVGLSSAVVALCIIFVPPVHMFAQLRGTYGLGLFAASWRTLALLCICGTAFVLFLLFVLAMTLH